MTAVIEAALFSRAEGAAAGDTENRAFELRAILMRCQATGVDHRVVTGLQQAMKLLDVTADTRYDSNAGPGQNPYASDLDFAEAMVEAEMDLHADLQHVERMQGENSDLEEAAELAAAAAATELSQAREMLAVAYAIPTKDPCDGCHASKMTAISSAEAAVQGAESRIQEANERLDVCESTAGVLEELRDLLTRAAGHLAGVIPALGEALAVIHEFLLGGGQLAREARQWHTGQLAGTTI